MPGVKFREVEDVVDDGEQALAAGDDAADVRLRRLRQVRKVAEQAREADDAGQGRPDLVAHVGEKFRLRLRRRLRRPAALQDSAPALGEVPLQHHEHQAHQHRGGEHRQDHGRLVVRDMIGDRQALNRGDGARHRREVHEKARRGAVVPHQDLEHDHAVERRGENFFSELRRLDQAEGRDTVGEADGHLDDPPGFAGGRPIQHKHQPRDCEPRQGHRPAQGRNSRQEYDQRQDEIERSRQGIGRRLVSLPGHALWVDRRRQRFDGRQHRNSRDASAPTPRT